MEQGGHGFNENINSIAQIAQLFFSNNIKPSKVPQMLLQGPSPPHPSFGILPKYGATLNSAPNHLGKGWPPRPNFLGNARISLTK